jgi:hypothetical protein
VTADIHVVGSPHGIEMRGGLPRDESGSNCSGFANMINSNYLARDSA